MQRKLAEQTVPRPIPPSVSSVDANPRFTTCQFERYPVRALVWEPSDPAIFGPASGIQPLDVRWSEGPHVRWVGNGCRNFCENSNNRSPLVLHGLASSWSVMHFQIPNIVLSLSFKYDVPGASGAT